MVAVRRTWTSPQVYGLDGPDAGSLRTIFESLTEYLRGHIGVWGNATGTTDANGDFVLTHNAGFVPEAVLISEQDAGDPTKMGPFHIQAVDENTLDVHFFEKNGNDRSTHAIHIHYLLLPPTRIRN